MRAIFAVFGLVSCVSFLPSEAQDISLPIDISVDPPYRLAVSGFRDVAFHYDGRQLSDALEVIEVCVDTNLKDLRLQIETDNGSEDGYNLLREIETGHLVGYSLDAGFGADVRPLQNGADEIFSLDFEQRGVSLCGPSERVFNIAISPIVDEGSDVVSFSEAAMTYDLEPGIHYVFVDRITFVFSPRFNAANTAEVS